MPPNPWWGNPYAGDFLYGEFANAPTPNASMGRRRINIPEPAGFTQQCRPLGPRSLGPVEIMVILEHGLTLDPKGDIVAQS